MTDPTVPLIDRLALQEQVNYNPAQVPLIQNLPKGPDLPVFTPPQDSQAQQPKSSGLEAYRQSLQRLTAMTDSQDGKITGGSTARSIYESKADKYDAVLPGADNEDVYGRGQGWADKMVNGVGKGIALTGTTFLQSTVGLVNGLTQWGKDGRFASLYDNDFNRSLDEFNKQMENYLPNYYTNRERGLDWYAPAKLFSANFIWDGVVKNMGFAAGAALSGGAYASGINAMSKSIPLAARLLSIGKTAETIAATEEALVAAGKSAEMYGKLKGLSDKFLSSYNVLSKGGRVVVAGLATTGEAGFEAFHNLNEYRSQKIQEFRDTHNGVNPFGSDLEDINSTADSVGNWSYGLNTGLLSVTNYIQFPKILGSSYTAEKGMINGLSKEIADVTKDATGKFIKDEATSNLGKALTSARRGAGYLFSIPEGFEEGAQYAISVGTKDYYNKQYKDLDSSFMDSLVEGVSKTLSTNEGAENILIGGLSGALMTGIGRFKQASAKSLNTADAITKFNQFKLSDFTKETFASVKRGVVLQEEREAAIKKGDVATSKDLEADYIINYLTPRIKYGRFDLVMADINEYKQLASTDEGFAQLQAEGKALEGDTRSQYLQRLTNLAGTANNIKSLYQSLQLRYGNLITPDGTPLYSSEVMDKMIYAATKVADYDDRLINLTSTLSSKGVLISPILDDVVKGNKESYNKAVKDVTESKSVDSDDILLALNDAAILAERRELFLNEYQDIKNNPIKHKKTEVKPVEKKVDDKGKAVTINVKEGVDLEIGEEYYGGETFNSEEAGEKRRYTKFTVVSEDDKGNVLIQTADGKRHTITKKGLAKYKLTKTSDVKSKNAIAFIRGAHREFTYNRGKGKHVVGTIAYDHKTDRLSFVSHDGKFKKPITREDLIPQKGFSVAKVYTHETLTPEEVENASQPVSQEEKLAFRNKVIVELYTEAKEELESIDKSIKENQEALEKAKKDIAEVNLTKKGTARTVSSINKVIKKASKIKEDAEAAILVLEARKEELVQILPYLQDLVENSTDLPESGKEMLQEMRDNINNVKELIDSVDREIKLNNSLIESVNYVLKAAFETLQAAIDKFKSANPNTPINIEGLRDQLERFLGEEGAQQFIDQKLGYTQLVAEFQEALSELEGDLKIPDLNKELSALQDKIGELQSSLKDLQSEQKAKGTVLAKFEGIAERNRLKKEEEAKLANDETIRKEVLGTADKGVQTVPYSKDYEPESKKSDLIVVTSSKAATKSTLPHHVRTNTFGVNLDKFSNRDDIKGVLVTSKNEAKLGLTGLTALLKGDSDVDVDKIVALVMVEKGRPVDINGKPLESSHIQELQEGEEIDMLNEAIFQVMPDPSLTWSKEFGGGTMFRKETTPEQIEYYKKQYTEWINDILTNPNEKEHQISASFGIPEYVTYLDDKGNPVRDYNAKVSVQDAGLIDNNGLINSPVVFIPTTDTTVTQGNVSFTSPLGRPLLKLPNGLVKLNNRKLSKKEASTIYKAILELSKDIFKNGNAKSEQSVRLTNWLKSIIYWGTPKNAAGHNSVWFSMRDNEFVLSISGKDTSYVFTPSNMEFYESEITALLEGMYNNVNSGMTDKVDVWNEEYEEILDISKSGEISTKTWPNYQTYLLSQEGRKAEELPLSTQMKPIEGEETNRKGIYFTINDTVENFSEPPVTKKKTVIAPKSSVTESPREGVVLDGKTINTYTSPSGKKIQFRATPEGKIGVIKGEDLDVVLAELTKSLGSKEKAQENIKNIIKKTLPKAAPANDEFNFTIPDEEFEEETEKPTAPAPKAAPTPVSNADRKPAKVQLTKEDKEIIEFQVDDIEEDVALRKKIEQDLAKFQPENWNEVEKWLKANFPHLPVYRVKNIIQATNGVQAWGMLKKGAIYVYENAEVGTIYHEVFEGVWKIFTDKTEQQSILSEFRKRGEGTKNDTFTDRETGKTIKFSDATDREIKEQLAEEFRDFVLFKKVPQKPVSGIPYIVRLFNNIVDAIKTFFVGKDAQSNTEKLFEKIGSGYYKQYSPFEQNLSFGEKGFISVDEAYADKYSEFRIKGMTASIVNDIMQEMTYKTLRVLLDNNESLFKTQLPSVGKEKNYTTLKTTIQKTVLKSYKEAKTLFDADKKNKAAEDVMNDSLALWKAVDSGWEELVKKHKEYLKAYSVEFDENDVLQVTDDDKTKGTDYVEATKIDNFRKANSAIKLLLSTIPMVDQNGKPLRSAINGFKLLPTSQVFMAIMNNVHNSRNIDEMLKRLKTMSEEDNNYKSLYDRLTKYKNSLSEIDKPHDWMLLSAFWKTFKKQNPDVKNVYIFENGDVEVGDSNLSTAAKQISSDYINSIVNTVKGKNSYFQYSEKEKAYIGNPSAIRNVATDTDEAKLSFLKTLGIEFKLYEIKKLSSDKQESFRKAVSGLKADILKAKKIATVSKKALDIKGVLMQLSLVRATIDNPEFDSTFFNIKGERTQSFIGTNPVSDLHDVLSQIKNKSALQNTPYSYLLTDVFSQGSAILDKMFNYATGDRIKSGEHLMKAGYADGMVDMNNGKKKQSSKQTYKERLSQEINLNLKGYYYNLVPGDSSMEWMVYMGNTISSENLLSGMTKTNKIFKGYFLSELELSREKRKISEKKGRKNTDLRFFKPILDSYEKGLHEDIVSDERGVDIVYNEYETKINKAVDAFIKDQTKALKNTLLDYGVINRTETGYAIEDLAFSEGNTSEEVLNRELSALSINFAINNIELHKLLYSDPYQYSDELKRIKNANSPRQSIINNSPAMNASLNSIWNEGLKKGDLGYKDMSRDYFNSATLADVQATSDLKDYGVYDETDGGGMMTLKAKRWYRIKSGEWTDANEAQYKHDIEYQRLVESGASSKAIAEFEKSNPDVADTYTPEKPIVFGNKLNGKEYNDVLLDKFALYPLSFRILHKINPDSNAIRLYRKMEKENIDYVVYNSGRKVGSEGENSLYNTDGSFNNLPFKNTIKVPHSIIAVQSEVPSKDEPVVTRGSQMTKLATLDTMEAGVPVDFESSMDINKKLSLWNAFTETEKKEKSPLYKEVKNNQSLLEALTENGYNNLLKRMGIEQVDGGFVITDYTKISKTLEDEILKREVNDNITDAFEGFRNGTVILEATPLYQQVRNILYSLADKNIVSPKISGGLKVQIPVTLLESVKAEEVTVNGKKAYQSDELSFYKDEDGKRVCEIMVGRWFDSHLSDEELLNYLNNTEEGKQILGGVAYRIPTQKQNSIDVFKIKKFLPREFGDSVVIPSELVKKVGSDFDIDKLSIYLKNTYKDAREKLKLLPFYGYGQKAIDKYKELFNEIKDNKITYLEGKLEKQAKLSNLFGDLALGLKGGKLAEKWVPIFQDWFKEDLIDGNLPVQAIEEIFLSRMERINKNLDTLTAQDVQEILASEMSERWYKQSLENEYIQSLENLISHPLNFKNLIKPNSADDLKTLAKDVTNKLGFEEFDYSSTGNMLKRSFMTRLRHAFVSGKYAIGIAAVNQTNHSLNQRQPIYIDQSRWDVLTKEDQYWLSGGTMSSKDANIKFKKYNKIEVDGKTVPTLSMINNANGESISDIIGQFIDGYVDISKGPWIMELGATPNVAGVWLFLVKIGVPIKDVAYFMNQPIIKDYLKSVESAGYSWLFMKDFVTDIKSSEKYAVKQQELGKTKEIPSNLGSSVGKEEFSAKERAEQQFILDEFLKYAKMANHMFLVTQGSNFDTANFNDPYLVFKKIEQLKKAQSTIISSVNDLIDNSFIGKLGEYIHNIRDAYATVLVSDRGDVRDVIENTLRPYVDNTDRDFVKLAQKAVNDLFDWAVQTDRKLNTQVTNILLSDRNVAKQVSDFVVSVLQNKKHPLYNNQVIKLVTPHFSEKKGGVNNLKIKNKDNKVYDQNQLIYAFSELKEYLNGQDSQLYGSLVRLAVLQSGLTNSPISFTSMLPHEDFSEIYNKTLSLLEEMPNLQDFKKLNVFQRNNWNNADIVPTRKAKRSEKTNKYNTNMNFFSNKNIQKAMESGALPQLLKLNINAREADNDVIVYSWVKVPEGKKMDQMKKEGDFSFMKKGLFQKVYQGGAPLTRSYTIKDEKTGENILITDFIYKAINAWGDSHSSDGVYFSANEFYTTGRPSVIDNGFLPVNKEVDDTTIVSYFDNNIQSTPSNYLTSGGIDVGPAKAKNMNITFEEEQSVGYRDRTIKNASADATIALAVDFNSAGEKLTKNSVLQQKKKYISIDANKLNVSNELVASVVRDLNSVNAKTLNIAGNGIYTMRGKHTQQQVDEFTFKLLKAVTESSNLKNKITSIRTGGQTGFDEAGTKAGIRLGIPTLTLAPKGWKFRNIKGEDISSEKQFKDRFTNRGSDKIPDCA